MNFKCYITRVTSWERVVNAARITANLPIINHEPSDQFKKNILLAEHSPIRLLEFDILLEHIPYWVAMHLVRHHVGVNPFVSTLRPDRTNSGLTNGGIPRDTPVNLLLCVNAQALINISKVRLCTKAAKETREVWAEVIHQISLIDPIVAQFCMPTCMYRQQCPEIKPCGYFKQLEDKIAQCYADATESKSES